MLSFSDKLVIVPNALSYLAFANEFAMNANTIATFWVCVCHKFLLSTKPSDLSGSHILSFAFKFETSTKAIAHFKFVNEFSDVNHSFKNNDIMNAL